jgi:Leucine-rich repeat (LRR) protein
MKVDLSYNSLTNITLPNDLVNLIELDVNNNQLSRLSLPAGMGNVQVISVVENPLTFVALPAGNPLLGQFFLALRSYNTPLLLSPSAKSPRRLADGHFAFDVYADIGNVVVQRSTDLTAWEDIGSVSVTWPNYPGVTFADTNSPADRAMYRLKLPLK